MWRIVASLFTVVGGAIAARLYARPAPPEESALRETAERERERRAPDGAAGPAAPGPPVRPLRPGDPGYHQVPASDEPLRPGWHRPRPDALPRSTYWPAVLALGVALTFWGLISTVFLWSIGLVFLIIGATGWIWELMYESRS